MKYHREMIDGKARPLRVGRFLQWFCVSMLATTIHFSPAEGAEGDIQYTVKEGDSLYLVATMYYGDPQAFLRIFQANRDALQTAYDKNAPPATKAANPSGRVQPHDLWPSTVIVLPANFSISGKVVYEQVLYERRANPLSRAAAIKLATATKVTLGDVMDLAESTRDPKIEVAEPPAPLGGYVPVSRMKGSTQREPRPDWHKQPKTDLHRCAVSVCTRYESLCFFECIMVARRIMDGNASCNPPPDPLPYEVPEKSNGDCAGWLK